jgi:hypothetical protein
VNAFVCHDQIVTVSNRGTADLTLHEVSVSGSASLTAVPDFDLSDPALVLWPDECTEIIVTFCPTSATTHSGLLTIVSDDCDQPCVQVSLIGNGLMGAVDEQSTVLETAVNAAISAGTLMGNGSGSSGAGRLSAFSNMVEAAGDLIEAGFTEDAIGQLRQAWARVDGQPRPPDFATGPDADLIRAQIQFLLDTLAGDPLLGY